MTTNPIYDGQEPVYDSILQSPQVDVLHTNVSVALTDGPTTHIRSLESDQLTVSETDDKSESDRYVTDKHTCQSKSFNPLDTNSSALGTDIVNIPWSAGVSTK